MKPLRFSPLFIFLAVLIIGTHSPFQALAQGTVLADNGFRPQQNGFSFANYGNDEVKENLTPDRMRELFGERVCKTVTNGQCILTAASKSWMDTQNKDMDGGHCEGMAVLSALIYSGKVKLADLDPSAQSVADLKLDNPKVQTEIAKWFITQITPPTADSKIEDKTPKEVVDTLVEKLQPGAAPFTMSIFQPGFQAGHAITPYSVIDMGNGVMRIMVYDNNYPGQERFLDVNTTTNTWNYTGSTNPDEQEQGYEGDASTLTLGLTPFEPRLQKPQGCEFCGREEVEKPAATEAVSQPGSDPTAVSTEAQPASTAAATQAASDGTQASGSTLCDYIFIDTGSNTDIEVSTKSGASVSYKNGKITSTIEGAYIKHVVSGGELNDDTPGVIIAIPKTAAGGANLTIAIKGSGPKTDVNVISCGHVQKVDGLSQADGKADVISVDPNATKIISDVDPDETVDFSSAHDNPAGNDYTFMADDVKSDADGSVVTFEEDPETGNVKLDSNDNLEFDIDLEAVEPDGDLIEKHHENITSSNNTGIQFDLDEAYQSDDLAVEEFPSDEAAFQEEMSEDQQESADFNTDSGVDEGSETGSETGDDGTITDPTTEPGTEEGDTGSDPDSGSDTGSDAGEGE
jgi:hypothetical protein